MALLSVSYVDPVEGIQGFLAIDRLVDGLAAGGLRIHPSVTAGEIARLAENMTLKQAAVGIRVGGAKAGLAMSADHPGRRDVLRRFLRALRPLVLDCYSIGPDVNTTLPELEAIGCELSIPCLKIAVAKKKGISEGEFLRRYALFEAPARRGRVNELRGATAVVAGAVALVDHLGIERSRATVAIQGAGGMGAPTAVLAADAGMRVVAWADQEKCLMDGAGLDVAALASGRRGGLLPRHTEDVSPPESVVVCDADVLVLAAVSDAIALASVETVRARGVVCAANLALSTEAEEALRRRGIPVVPDLVAGVGGSLSVEALYCASPDGPEAILRHVDARAAALAREILRIARDESRPSGVVARARAREHLEALRGTDLG